MVSRKKAEDRQRYLKKYTKAEGRQLSDLNKINKWTGLTSIQTGAVCPPGAATLVYVSALGADTYEGAARMAVKPLPSRSAPVHNKIMAEDRQDVVKHYERSKCEEGRG
jgi:hypothetical protein